MSRLNSSPTGVSADRVAAAPSFTGSALTPNQKTFLSLFPKAEAWGYKLISKVKDYSKGEVGGILINSIGTGAVAPWFIAYNPFVKAEPNATEAEKEEISKTKKYTAMRQPVSAALAILIQVGVQKPIDKILQKITNDKDVAKHFGGWVLNQTSLNDDAYMERMIKKEIKKGTILPGYKLVDGRPVPEELKDTVARVKKIRQDKQINAIVDTLKSDGVIKMGDFKINDSAVAEVLNNRLDDYIAFSKDQKMDDAHLEKYKKRASELIENEQVLKDILGKEELDKLPKLSDGRINPKELKTYIQGNVEKAPNEAVKGILKEIVEDYDFTRESLCTRTLERIDKIKSACDGEYDPAKYKAYLEKHNSVYDAKIAEFEALRIKDTANATSESIKETIPKIVKACHYDDAEDKTLNCIFKDSGIFKKNSDTTLTERVYKDVVKSYKEFAGHKFGIFKQLSKVAVGVAITLPITCYALNWVYPRFMDIFFPSLGKSSTDAPEETKGGNK